MIKAYAARTFANDPLQKFMFRVTIPGLPTGIGFQKVGGLTREVGVVEYLEGLYEHTHKLPGREKVGEVTLERGAYASQELEALYKSILSPSGSRVTVTIEILNRFGETKRTYTLEDAWVSKWEGSDLDATSDDVAIEKMTLQFERFLDPTA